jgi:hypothetical protein
MVNVKQIAEMGAYVKLLEYGASSRLGEHPPSGGDSQFSAVQITDANPAR